MADAIEYEQFDQNGQAAEPGSDTDLTRLSSIPMELSVEIGRTHMTVGETLDLGVGSVVTLERLAGETADLLVNGSAIARGEVVVIDEQYGLRVTEILDREADDVVPGVNGAGANGASGEDTSALQNGAEGADAATAGEDGAAGADEASAPA